MGDSPEQRDEGLGNHLICPDDQRILDLMKVSGETLDESARMKLHKDVFDILQNSPEGYAVKSQSRIRSILYGPFLQASVGVESLYRDAVTVFMRNLEDGKFRGEASLSTYLCGIAIIVARNELRKIKRYIEKNASEHDLSEPIDNADTGEPDSRLDQINQALNQMDDQESVAILRLFYFEEHSDREIAKHLGYNGGNLDTETDRIKKKRQRTLQRLRDQFGGKA